MARPSEYNFALCGEICEKITDGANIKDVLKSKTKYPSFPTWCRWKREHIELHNLYINAIQDKSESSVHRIDEILLKVLDGTLCEKKARLLVYAEQWKAAKFYPKMFGSKPTVDALSNKELNQQVTVFQLPDNGRG